MPWATYIMEGGLVQLILNGLGALLAVGYINRLIHHAPTPYKACALEYQQIPSLQGSCSRSHIPPPPPYRNQHNRVNYFDFIFHFCYYLCYVKTKSRPKYKISQLKTILRYITLNVAISIWCSSPY